MKEETNENEKSCTGKKDASNDKVQNKKAETENQKRKQYEKKKMEEKRKLAKENIDSILKMLSEFGSKKRPLESVFPIIKTYMDIEDSDKLGLLDTDRMNTGLKKIENDLKINHGLLENSSFTPAEVVKRSTALDGIYFSNDKRNWVEQKSSIADVKGEIYFKSPCKSETQRYEEFYDMKVKHVFDRAVDISGVDFAAKLCIRALIAEGTAGYDYKQDKENLTDSKTNTAKVTYNKTLYSVVPVVSWEATLYNTKLAEEPIALLHNISYLLLGGSIKNARTLVLEFFDKYGSHLYRGRTHFGGIIRIGTTFESDGMVNQDQFKNIVSSQHSTAVTGAFSLFSFVSVAGEASFGNTTAEAKIGAKYNKKELSKITNSMTKHGGPLEVNSVQLWKRGLVDNNSTWVVVSSGEPEISEGKLKIDNYVGVWELVLNEAECFNDNAMTLSKFLLDTWKEKTGFEADTSAIDLFEIQQTEKRFKSFIQGIKQKMKPTLLAKILTDLHAEVAKTKKVAASRDLWKKELMGNEIVHDLFEKLTLDEGQDDDVKTHVKELLQLADHEKFPGKEEILCWLNKKPESCDIPKISTRKLKSVEEFLDCLKEPYLRQKRLNLNKVEGNKEKKMLFNQKMTTEIASSTFELLTCLRKENDHIMYVYLLSLLLLLDYDIEQYAFRSYLTTTRLESFLCIASNSLEHYHQIGQKGSATVEVFVFHLLLNTILKETGNKEYEAQCMYDKVYHHIEDMNALFQQQIRKSLNKNLLESLCCLENIIHRDDINKRPVIMWNYFEKLPELSLKDVMDKKNANSMLTAGSEILHLLDLFGWKKHFPGKLTIKNVLSLNQMNSSDLKKEDYIPWIIMQRIMATDFNYREQVLQDFVKTMSTNSKDELVNEDECDDLLTTTTSVRSDDQAVHQWENLSPTDVFMAIFQCCDPFLKQIIVQKISVCQLAVPYYFSDCSKNCTILSLFPLREVYHDCRSESVATASLKTVSFIRIGNGLGKSKSKIINELLRKNNEEHSTFFHRDCPRGMTKRTIISKGLIEATWYVPREEAKSQVQEVPDMQIPEPFTVLNLRGDAAELGEQIDIMILVSNIIFIFIKYEDLKNDNHKSILETIHKSSCLVLLLTNATKKDIHSDGFIQSYRHKIGNSRTIVISTFDMKLEREMNADELKDLLRKNIRFQLKKIEKGIILEKVAGDNRIPTDETTICSSIQLKAKLLFQQIQESKQPSSCRKQHFTPLQCEELWQKWSAKQKEQKRQTNQTHYDTEETLPKEMKALRKKQVETCNEMPDTVAEFVCMLLHHIDENDAINYLLFFFRQQLDNDSKVIIPTLQEEFRRAYEKYESEKVKTSDLKRHIDEIENKLAKSSFGLEHFFREIGQIYEAFIYCKETIGYTISYKTWKIIQKLPLTVAKLLLLGQPLELMDGDAANVPLKWIAAVFDQLKQILHNGKLLSISVLGIQSSGKSTLLNTMFGLRFAVSAGRCTRGLYAQIIPVAKENSSFNFDYAMVIDTEGLRAPELSSGNINHDNELATLVIGLADTVLINIKGETIADMENVLQIVVHGLLRLKQANKDLHLQHRCIFVHQNVSAEDARNQMLQGNKNTMERLDKMTKEVAVQEGIPEISYFKDVIEFDPTKDVRFLPDLWNGTRPMAPASTTYSSKAVEIRTNIVEYASTGKTVFMNVEDKKLHLQSLWNGILNENFVFSFRNCLEVKAYSLLESEFQSVLSTLDFDKLQWMVENIKPRLCKQNTIEQLDLEAARLKNDFNEEIKQKRFNTEKRLVTFINKSELSDIMITWKAHKLQYLVCVTDTMVQDVVKKIRHEIQQRVFSLSTNDLLAKKKRQVNLRAKEVALSFKDKKLTKDDIIEQFQQLWVTWINELIPETAEETIETKDRILEEDIKSVLHEKFGDQKHLITKGLTQKSLSKDSILVRQQLKHSVKEIKASNITGKKTFTKVKMYLVTTPKQPVLDTINGIFSDIDETFESLFKQETEYEISQLRQIVDKLRAGFKTFNEKNELDCSLTPKFEVFIALHVARHSYHRFKALNREYERNHGLRNRLLRYKPQAQQLFIDICQAKSQEMIATNILCTSLQELVRERVERNLPPKIQQEMVNMYFNQKRIIMKNVLEELAEKDDFQVYREYIINPGQFVRRWIKEKTDNVVFYNKREHKSKYESWVEDDIGYFLEKLINAIKFASDNCSNGDTYDISIKCWLDMFCAQVEPMKFLIANDTFQHLSEYTISSFAEFKVNIITELREKVNSNIKDYFQLRSPDEMKWPGESAYDNIFDALWGCTENCPLCGEPCQKSMKNHGSENDRHTCIQHRPSGINGSSWRENDKLTIEICNFKVQSSIEKYCRTWCGCPNKEKCEKSHPFKEYRTFYPEWDIAPSTENSHAAYWMWFMNSHKKNLAEYYSNEQPDIPESWNDISKEQAIKSLSNMYGL